MRLSSSAWHKMEMQKLVRKKSPLILKKINLGVIDSYKFFSCSLNGCSLIMFWSRCQLSSILSECLGDENKICCVLLSSPFRMGMVTSMSRSWMPCYETFTRKTRRWDETFVCRLLYNSACNGLACDLWHLMQFLSDHFFHHTHIRLQTKWKYS